MSTALCFVIKSVVEAEFDICISLLRWQLAEVRRCVAGLGYISTGGQNVAPFTQCEDDHAGSALRADLI